MTSQPDPSSFDGAAVSPETSEIADAPEASDTVQHNSWTPDRQAAFLRELSATHNVAAAARAVGMSRQSAYKLRTRLQGEPFDKAWSAAFITRFDVLAEAALDRALNGVEVPHYYNGELLGTSRRYDERLTLALLGRRKYLAPPAPAPMEPASTFEDTDLINLIERVESGPEQWRDTPDDEINAQYALWKAQEDAALEGRAPSDESAEPPE